MKGKIFDWAFAVGQKTMPLGWRGNSRRGCCGVQYALADKLVFSKIKARMGGKIRFFVSGSAALSREVQEWFYAAGLLVLEGYGLTETSAATCRQQPASHPIRHGRPAGARHRDQDRRRRRDPGQGPGRDARLPQRRPRPPPRSLSLDGWFATGDIGELDDQATCGSPTARRT